MGSEIPSDVIEKIGGRLRTETEILCFRSVCKLWRSSMGPFEKYPSTPLRIPFVGGDLLVDSFFEDLEGTYLNGTYCNGNYCNLTEKIVYLLESPETSESWLVKVETLSNGKKRLFHVLNNKEITLGNDMPVLNTLRFRMHEVCKIYTVNLPVPTAHRTGVLSRGEKGDGYTVMIMDDLSKLWYFKSGAEKWKLVPGDARYTDVINISGKFYAVDKCGGGWEIDYMFNATRLTTNELPYVVGGRKLVELYEGQLHMVEQIKSRQKQPPYIPGCECTTGYSRVLVGMETVEVKIWKLNREVKKWVETRLSNDRILFVGEDCVFAVASENGGRVFYPESCIEFYTDDEKAKPVRYELMEIACCDTCKDLLKANLCFVPNEEVRMRFKALHNHNIAVCDFRSGKIGSLLRFPEFADTLWPPPSWLNTETLLADHLAEQLAEHYISSG